MTNKGVSKLGLILIYIGMSLLLIVDQLTFIKVADIITIINDVAMIFILIGTSINTGALFSTAEQIKVDKTLDTPSKIVDRIIENTQVNKVERQNCNEVVKQRSDEDNNSTNEEDLKDNNIKGW